MKKLNVEDVTKISPLSTALTMILPRLRYRYSVTMLDCHLLLPNFVQTSWSESQKISRDRKANGTKS